MENDKQDQIKKRGDYLHWPEYFMATAFLAAKRSKDPTTQVGAVIVNNDNKIVGTGYNGFPIGCSDDEFPWGKELNTLNNKHLYVVHAEVNAILNKNCSCIKGSTMYVALFPCNECAKYIIQSGIKEVVYMSDKHAMKSSTIASKKMFDACMVKYTQFQPINKRIVIDFDAIDWDRLNQTPDTPKKIN